MSDEHDGHEAASSDAAYFGTFLAFLGRPERILKQMRSKRGGDFGVVAFVSEKWPQGLPKRGPRGPKRRTRGSQSSIWEGSGDVLGRIFLGLGKVLVSFLKVWRPLGFWLLCGVLTCLLLFLAAFWLFWQLFDS